MPCHKDAFDEHLHYYPKGKVSNLNCPIKVTCVNMTQKIYQPNHLFFHVFIISIPITIA